MLANITLSRIVAVILASSLLAACASFSTPVGNDGSSGANGGYKDTNQPTVNGPASAPQPGPGPRI